jgi:hypothetical protein
VGVRSGIDLWSREKSLPLTEIEEGFFDRLGVVYKLRDSKVQSQFSPIPCQDQHSNNASLVCHRLREPGGLHGVSRQMQDFRATKPLCSVRPQKKDSTVKYKEFVSVETRLYLDNLVYESIRTTFFDLE